MAIISIGLRVLALVNIHVILIVLNILLAYASDTRRRIYHLSSVVEYRLVQQDRSHPPGVFIIRCVTD